MSYEKLKSIRVSKTLNKVFFMSKSNNDTEPYRPHDCDIHTFLHNSAGNVFQYSDKELNGIINEYNTQLAAISNDPTSVWFEIEYGNIDTLTDEIRILFYKMCDKIANVNKKFVSA